MKTHPDAPALADAALPILAELVALDTTSRRSNLLLIELVEARLAAVGVPSHRVENHGGSKTNLYATLGAPAAGGVVLSGHTDVVPVDGQVWTSDPFSLTRRGNRLFGRGTCDMKAFIALALAAAPIFAAPGRLKRPVHLALSYDEEVGCLGAPSMIAEMVERLPPIAAVIVGEPTNMTVVGAHKGTIVHRVTVTGHEAHSSMTHLGLSANTIAIRLMTQLESIAARLEKEAEATSRFVPAHATLTIGEVSGGTAINILARQCTFGFDLRCPPGLDPQAVLAPFYGLVGQLDAEMRSRFPETGILMQQLAAVPAMAMEEHGAAVRLLHSITGDHRSPGAVAYAAEAGQFQLAGLPTAICGPGSIDQAHQPDEHIEMEQIAAGAGFMPRLADTLSA